jgi:hypothetical protein
MSLTRFATLLTFAGTIALTYVCSADPQMEISAPAPPATAVKKEISAELAVSRGSVKLGGSLNTTTINNYGTLVNVSPSAQYFLLNRVAIGLEGNFGWDKWNLMNRALRPSLSYYFYAADNLAVFVKQDIGFNSVKYGNYDGQPENLSDYSYIDGSTKLGLDWFLNQNVAVTPMLGATYTRLGEPTYVGSIALTVYL